MLENVIDAPMVVDADSPRAVLVKVSAPYEFSRLVRTLGTGRWIFRGHADKDWRLESGLERQLVQKGLKSTNKIVQAAINSVRYDKYRASDELYAIDQFKRYASMALPKLEHLVEWLAAMQHYGTATRLLDFTRSIYVALYFAFENRLCKTDAAIYAIQYSRLLHNDTLSKELIKDQRRVFIKHKKENVDLDSERYIRENFYNNRKELQDSLIKLADKCIETRSGSVGIIPVNVPGVNERLVAQAGLFLMPRTFTSFQESLAESLSLSERDITDPQYKFNMLQYPSNKSTLKNASLIKIIIPRELSTEMWNLLAQANVSALNLFPGLDGIAKSIRYNEPLYE